MPTPPTNPHAAWGWVAAILLWQAFGVILSASLAHAVGAWGRPARRAGSVLSGRRSLRRVMQGYFGASPIVLPFVLGWVAVFTLLQAQMVRQGLDFFATHGLGVLANLGSAAAVARLIAAIAAGIGLGWLLLRERLPLFDTPRWLRALMTLALLAAGVWIGRAWHPEPVGGGARAGWSHWFGVLFGYFISALFAAVGTAGLVAAPVERRRERDVSLMLFYTLGMIGWGIMLVITCGILVG